MELREYLNQNEEKILYNGKYLPDEFEKLRNGFWERERQKEEERQEEEKRKLKEASLKKEKVKIHENDTPLIYDIIKQLTRIVEIVAVFSVIFTFIFGITKQTDLAMYPSINQGDLMLFYRIEKNYKVNDVIAYKYDGTIYTARVVAVARRYSKYYKKRINY